VYYIETNVRQKQIICRQRDDGNLSYGTLCRHMCVHIHVFLKVVILYVVIVS